MCLLDHPLVCVHLRPHSLQGESDAGISDVAPGYRVYEKLLGALLASRAALRQPKLPFRHRPDRRVSFSSNIR